MPQNYRTKNVALPQHWYERVAQLPEETPASPARRPLFASGYRVVDVTLADGRRLTGVLQIGDDLLIPEDDTGFTGEEITAIEPTPRDAWPDFTITDAEAVHHPRGHSIEHGNLMRLCLFGPERPATDWRTEPIEDAHEEAQRIDRNVDVFAPDLPACLHGPSAVEFTPEGIRVTFRAASRDESETRVIRPVTAAVWRALLTQEFTLAPDFTFGHLLDLLDLPPEVAREVYLRSCRYDADGFAPWIAAARAPLPPTVYLVTEEFDYGDPALDAEPVVRGTTIPVRELDAALSAARDDANMTPVQVLASYPDIPPDRYAGVLAAISAWEGGAHETYSGLEAIVVRSYATHDGYERPAGSLDRYVFFFDCSGLGRPKAAADEHGWSQGDQVNYSMSYGGPGRWKDVPLRYDPVTELEASHEELMAYYRGPRRAWEVAGREGPEPEHPVRLRVERPITLREFLGALFDNITSHNSWDDDD